MSGTALAASISVSTTVDEAGGGGACSLREAVRAANTDAVFGGCTAGSGPDTISLPNGTYTLTTLGQNEDAGLTGDLDIAGSVTINGASSSGTVIDGNNTDAGLRHLHRAGGHGDRDVEPDDQAWQPDECGL